MRLELKILILILYSMPYYKYIVLFVGCLCECTHQLQGWFLCCVSILLIYRLVYTRHGGKYSSPAFKCRVKFTFMIVYEICELRVAAWHSFTYTIYLRGWLTDNSVTERVQLHTVNYDEFHCEWAMMIINFICQLVANV